MRDSNFIKKDEKYIPHFRRIVPYSEWGRNTRREGGGATFPARRKLYFTFGHAATSERVLHECAYNSETIGDGVPAGKIFDFSRGARERQPRGENPAGTAMENPLVRAGFSGVPGGI